ncbi:hypothetical protein V6N12_007088 [Hibiscus sabdariffa]|uniref:Uncharacterized protein n=1 Tax=Hibiscus sabdariffa TaxID=183260 RepID=A0ABR2F0S7_9ROSI
MLRCRFLMRPMKRGCNIWQIMVGSSLLLENVRGVGLKSGLKVRKDKENKTLARSVLVHVGVASPGISGIDNSTLEFPRGVEGGEILRSIASVEGSASPNLECYGDECIN